MEQVILNKNNIETILNDSAEKIIAEINDFNKFAIIGVQTRGVNLSERIKKKVETLKNIDIKSGILDITFHRDDLSTRGILPEIKETRIEFDIEGMIILLVDDVIYSGRTSKAAIETLMTFGRPSKIKLFALVDRGNRDLPIQPDYCGYKIETKPGERIKVRLQDTDGEEDKVIHATVD